MNSFFFFFFLLLCRCFKGWSYWDISVTVTQEVDESFAGEHFPSQPIVLVHDKKKGELRSDFVGFVSVRLYGRLNRNKLGIIKDNFCSENDVNTDDEFAARVPFVRGIAKFSNLCINKADEGYRIEYVIIDEYGLILAQTLGRSLRVKIGSVFRLGVVRHPSEAYGGIPWLHQPIISIQDKGGNTILEDIQGTVRSICCIFHLYFL
jgi:hypothetical protein